MYVDMEQDRATKKLNCWGTLNLPHSYASYYAQLYSPRADSLAQSTLAWQVQAIARDGVDELGLFEHGGFSEIYWFTLNENCPVPTGLKADPRLC